ncbi:uncharacterized protein LOC111340249 isoform X2 [Stylophora pistillata]|uniref:uncharacterized protein LOC111340249 isoform X2 n=1 Tax=Stylophora pistillata TaxID=50429 RepID=UPI000C0463F6|nr:uncharacterized protein LOC111340249 isoform X2 [Stylophora pistillata]
MAVFILNPEVEESSLHCSTLVGGFLEACSLCYITVVMVTTLPVSPDFLVLFMCSIAGLPLTLREVYGKLCQRNHPTSLWDTLRSLVSTLCFLAGNIMLSLKVTDLKGVISGQFALFLLSVVWSPKFRKLQIQSKAGEEEREMGREQSTNVAEECVDTLRKPGTSSKFDPKEAFGAKPRDDEILREISNSSEGSLQSEPGPPRLTRTAQAKAAVISSLCKLVFIPAMAVAFSSIFDIVNIGKPDISDGFKAITTSNPSFLYFIFHIMASFFGYHFGWISCSLRMQKIGLALPLTLATPIAVMITHLKGLCETDTIPLPCASEDRPYVLSAGLLLWSAQCLGAMYYLWGSPGKILGKVYDLLWIPCYNGVCLEQYLLTNKRNLSSDLEPSSLENASSSNQKDSKLHVFICTTMYHEKREEMEQLLESVYDVLKNGNSEHHFEAHVFFDGCIRTEELNSYVLQLASLVENTLKVEDLNECIKVKTAFGMQLKWKLKLKTETSFTIHLKDNAKVKNKKRWSQVMYMSYVLDFKIVVEKLKDDQCFILATDGDVKFTHESVEALIDQICEDPRTGAVCARTYPLGSGPVVWYQIFDYAVGHWFQKVTNHMLGSVLCCPGCFSLYRCKAVRDVLPNYATCADNAFECLTKDMGEDRWMCTLMIQSGWRLSYCAAAENSTFCPESFDEFYKQRRRWAPSTLANLVLLIREWRQTTSNNEHISSLFIVYQAFLVFSTVIGCSTVILVIVGGMVLAGVPIGQITTSVLLSLVVVGYVFVCLYAPPKWQLKVSKILTFSFSVIMCIVAVGLAVQVSNDLKERKVEPTMATTIQTETTSSTTPKPLEHHLPAGVSSLYLAGLTGIFVISALLHPSEITCFFYGFLYFLALPSGYLLLTVYAICNLTDSSWGTREENSGEKSNQNSLWDLCLCCRWTRSDKGGNERKKLSDSEGPGPSGLNTNTGTVVQEGNANNAGTAPVDGVNSSEAKGKTPLTKDEIHAIHSKKAMNLLNSNEEDLSEKGLVDFLREGKLEKYYQGFLDNGYEFVDDLFGIKEEDLKQIEISEEDRPKLLDQTKRILPHRKKHEMPEDIEGWLKKHHLRDYYLKITGEFKHLWELRKLKTKPERELKEFAEKKFGIKKPGHFKRLLRAVYSLQVKEHVPMTVSYTEYILTSVRSVESDSQYYPKDEITFWEKLLEEGFLSPHNAASASTSSAEKDLQKLRITTFWVFGVSNFLWMILILTLVPRRDLKILGLDVIALSFLIIYGGIFIVQFLALLCHRVKTIMHILARTPWTVHKKSDSGKNEGKNGQSVLQQRKNRRVHPYFQA